MSSKVRVLTDHTINKIAAGEVIENSASVVKELVENAIDAGASEISVEIRGGGRQLIRVTDNGCGMSADDAVLCLERHATSKIRAVEDLHSLATMGFRGEALPSIASISKFMLLTCPQSDSDKPSQGTMVSVDGGQIMKCCPAACPPGTSIEVKNLFFNVPVRKKFLKSPAHDTQEILKVMTLLALGHPKIKFLLTDHQETLLSTTKGPHTLEERVKEVLGPDFSHSLCPVELVKGDYVLTGFIGMPSHTRHNRTGQYLFINQRAVVSPFISFSIREGYGPMLATNRHPLFVIYLTMPGELVDVNVHPQKREVRLRQEHILKEMLIQAVEEALQNTGMSPVVELPPVLPMMPAFMSLGRSQETVSRSQESGDRSQELAKVPHIPKPRPVLEEPSLFVHEAKTPSLAPPKVLTTLPGYILIDPTPLQRFAADGLCLVDQRAAHARVIFEKLSQADKQTLAVQALLIPYTCECTPPQAAWLRRQLDSLNRLGIRIHESGPTTFLVDAVPQVFGHADIGEVLAEVLSQMEDYGSSEGESARRLAQAASRVAISKSKRLSYEEAQSLLQQLMHCQHPYQCPNGKSTFAQIGKEELAKIFAKGTGHGL